MLRIGMALLLGTAAQAATITVGLPPGLINAFPFGTPISPNPGDRYQQAYAASSFPGPVLIEEITFFRVSANRTPTEAVYDVYLSTVGAPIGALSTTDLAGNPGPDEQLFASRQLKEDLDLTLTFSGTPFLYDPSRGNLLLDLRLSSIGKRGNAAIGVRNEAGLFARYHNFSGTGGNDGFGMVTQFTVTPVPEPGSVGLLALAALLLGARGLRR